MIYSSSVGYGMIRYLPYRSTKAPATAFFAFTGKRRRYVRDRSGLPWGGEIEVPSIYGARGQEVWSMYAIKR